MRVATLVVAVALLAGCGGAGAKLRLSQAPPNVAKRLLVAQLRAKRLDYTWIACVCGRTDVQGTFSIIALQRRTSGSTRTSRRTACS